MHHGEKNPVHLDGHALYRRRRNCFNEYRLRCYISLGALISSHLDLYV